MANSKSTAGPTKARRAAAKPGAGRSRSKAPAAVAQKPGSVSTAASPAGGRLWVVPVCMVLVLALVGAFVFWHARYLASLKFEMVRTARIVPQGHDLGETTDVANLSGDPQGHTFSLENQPGMTGRLQRFDKEESSDSLVYQPRRKGQDLNGPVDVDCDAQGTVYVLLKDGRIQVLSNELAYERTIQTKLVNCSALSLDSSGRIFVADEPENKVVIFSNDGRRAGEFGAAGDAGTPLDAPVFLRIAKDDEVVVVENTPTGLRGRVFNKDLTLRKTFLVDKIKEVDPVRMGLNAQLKVFFNDPAGTVGIACWDLKTGKYFGSSQATKDGVQFVSPGSIGADRFTDDVYVHTIPGLVKCQLPAPGAQQ